MSATNNERPKRPEYTIEESVRMWNEVEDYMVELGYKDKTNYIDIKKIKINKEVKDNE